MNECVHGFNVAAGKREVNFNALILYILVLLYIVLGNYRVISPCGPTKPYCYDNIIMYSFIICILQSTTSVNLSDRPKCCGGKKYTIFSVLL